VSKRPASIYNDPGYFYSGKLLGRIFVVASALLLLGLAWMIWVDFDRDWKETQRKHREWEARKLAVEALLLETQVQDDRARLAARREKVAAELEEKEEELSELEERIQAQEGTLYGATMAYNKQRQFTSQAEYWAHEATGGEREAWAKEMRRELDKEHRLRDAKQMAQEDLDALLARRKEKRAELDEIVAAERKNSGLQRLEIVRANIEKKRDYNPAREIPLLDFLAPPTKVEQIVLDDLVDNYEFATPKKVDRCGTCHVGSFRVGFSAEKYPIEDPRGQTFEEGLYRFVYGVLESVWDKVPANDPYAHEKGLQRKVDIHHATMNLLFKPYDEYSGEFERDDRNVPKYRKFKRDPESGKWVEAEDGESIAAYYRTVLERMEGHWRTHPHFDSMVSSSSPHPYEQFGCTSCHLGRGWSTDFGYAWHNPGREEASDWMTEARAHEKDEHLPESALYDLDEAMMIGALTSYEEAAWNEGREALKELEAARAAKGEGAPEVAALEEELERVQAQPAYARATGKAAALRQGWVPDKERAKEWERELGRSKNKLKYWHWPQHAEMLTQSSCLKCHKKGLYETAEPEYEHVRLGKPDPEVPDTFDWQDHSRAANRTIEAENRIFIPEEPEPYRPEALERGLDNFLRFGCYGCHKLDATKYPLMENVRPKVGPPLDHIAAKVERPWFRKWVRNPKDFRENTRMPRFWGLSNNSHDFKYRFAATGFDEVDGEKWAEAEIYAITEYLWHESRQQVEEDAYADEPWQGGDARRGLQIVLADGQTTENRAKACIACHDIGGEETELYDQELVADAADPAYDRRTGWSHRMSRRQGPNLAGIASKVKPGWLYSWLRDPRGYWHETNMPDLRLTEQEAKDVTAYLLTLRHEDFERLPDVGYDRNLIFRIAQELKVGEAKEPTKNALAIVQRWRDDYDRDPRPPSEKGPDPLVLYVGENLVKHYGCFGCHTISDYKDATPIGTEVTEWGSKLIDRLEFNHAPIPHTRFDFAYLKMRNPRIYDYGMPRRDKPYERLRMPRFGFTTKEAKDIATFMVALVDDPIPEASQFEPDERERDVIRGREIVRRYNCQGCHVIENEGGDIWPIVENVKWRPPDLLGQGMKTQPAWLFEFMKDPAFVTIPGVENSDRVRPWHSIRMPTFHLTDEESRAVVRYFAALSNEPADFESTPEDSLVGPDAQYDEAKTLTLSDPDDRTKKYTKRVDDRLVEARMLFQELQCKSCHAPGAPIANQAPNFRHTLAGRLRDQWIETWLWNPSLLQPGTAMPTFFANEEGPIVQDPQFFTHGPAETQADRQIRALRDYIRHHYREEDR